MGFTSRTSKPPPDVQSQNAPKSSRASSDDQTSFKKTLDSETPPITWGRCPPCPGCQSPLGWSYHIFSRGSRNKPSFATVPGRGDNPTYISGLVPLLYHWCSFVDPTLNELPLFASWRCFRAFIGFHVANNPTQISNNMVNMGTFWSPNREEKHIKNKKEKTPSLQICEVEHMTQTRLAIGKKTSKWSREFFFRRVLGIKGGLGSIYKPPSGKGHNLGHITNGLAPAKNTSSQWKPPGNLTWILKMVEACSSLIWLGFCGILITPKSFFDRILSKWPRWGAGGLEKVTALKFGHFGYPCSISSV